MSKWTWPFKIKKLNQNNYNTRDFQIPPFFHPFNKWSILFINSPPTFFHWIHFFLIFLKIFYNLSSFPSLTNPFRFLFNYTILVCYSNHIVCWKSKTTIMFWKVWKFKILFVENNCNYKCRIFWFFFLNFINGGKKWY